MKIINSPGRFLFFLIAILSILTACSKTAPPLQSFTDLDMIRSVDEVPYAKMKEIDLDQVELLAGFWNDRFELVKEVTIPNMLEYMKEDTVSHWRNFLIAAGEIDGEWHGTYWHDGDFYKWFEALVNVYEVTKEPAIDEQMDEIIEIIAKVQADDGYISMFTQLTGTPRWIDKQHHELYNMGHLMTAAYRHHQATGKTNLLAVAMKTGDYLFETFAVDRPDSLNMFGFNPSNIMGCVDLYRATGVDKYLHLADTFVTMRGTTKPGVNVTWEQVRKHRSNPGQDQNQDFTPFRKEDKVVGHAVTGTYLYAGAADLYMYTGEEALLQANERLWKDLMTRKYSIHGGVCPIDRGMTVNHHDVHEAFANPYELPLRKAYNETCSNIGSGMWSWRMFRITGEAKYMDQMEHVFFNAGISGLGIDGDSFFYTNFQRRYAQPVPGMAQHDHPERIKFLSSYCCPPQLARTISRMRKYFYSISSESPEIWINMYGASGFRGTLPDGQEVVIVQHGNYPWDGRIKVEVLKSGTFSLNLRIPAWAEGAKVAVNGKKQQGVRAGQYHKIDRTWQAGDNITLDIPLKVRLVRANPMVEEARNQIAVMRGPVTYCLESPDVPDNISPMDIFLHARGEFKPEFRHDFLNGLTVLSTKASYIRDEDWSVAPYNDDELYKEVKLPEDRVVIQLIPYYAWANRGPAEMTVWCNVDW